jgi:hypothetical protein
MSQFHLYKALIALFQQAHWIKNGNRVSPTHDKNTANHYADNQQRHEDGYHFILFHKSPRLERYRAYLSTSSTLLQIKISERVSS